jgi:CSLREA domain-containing protein
MKVCTSFARIAGAVAALLSLQAGAGEIVVNTTTDDNAVNTLCSLREAMSAQFRGSAFQGCTGATAAGPNVIRFSANGTYRAVEQLADVVEGRSLQITGAGREIVITCTANRIFEAEANAVLSIDHLTLAGCNGSGGGLAVNAKNADLSLTDLVIRDFTSTTSANGAAVAHTGGSLTLRNVQMRNNRVDDGNPNTSGGSGGALSISNVSLPKTVEIADSVFANNRADKNGGAVHVSSSPTLGHRIRFSNITFESNLAFGDQGQDGGGALWIQTDDDDVHDFLITDSLFRSNIAERGLGGAIVIANASRVAYDSVDAPDAGGIFASHFQGNVARGATANDGSGGAIFTRGRLTVVQSSFLGNKSERASGGAIAFGSNGYTSTIANTTLQGNAAAKNGGAIARLSNTDAVALIHVTIAGGAAGGAEGSVGGGAIYNVSNAGGITAQNSILGGSATAVGIVNVGENCRGAVLNSGRNLQYGSGNGCGLPAMPFANPQLGAVRAADGPNDKVWVMRIDSDFSPALNAGNDAVCRSGPILRFDASGTARRPLVGTRCDLGAHESDAAPDAIFGFGFEVAS